jgi:NAD(P)-dependent dehydrogenase (short-subunit alcohol dehydrogenase family)
VVGNGSFDFAGESAIVTGSTKGIGRGIATALAKADANVVINSRTEADVNSTVEELSEYGDGDIVGVTADLSDPECIEDLVAEAIDAVGQLDILVNNAAVWPNEQSMWAAELDDWDATMAVNVRAQFYCSKLVAAHMIDNNITGNIINILSQAGDRRAGAHGIYGASKSAGFGLTWRLAYDLAPEEIRVNGVSTGITDSAQLRSNIERDLEKEESAIPTVEERLESLGEEVPAGRIGKPEDIADAVLYLASDRAEYIIGSVLRVSGGYNLK